MSLKKFPLPFLLAVLLLVFLPACESRVDQAHKQITAEKVRADLVGRSVLLPGEGEFVMEEPGYVKLIGLDVAEGTARASVHVKALSLSTKGAMEYTLPVE